MSRGGRGGFRGGGGGHQSGAMQLISFDLLKDLGSGSLFNVQTALFPEMDVPMARKPNNAETTQWNHKDECIRLIQASPFYIVPPPPPPDVERYSDRYKKRKTVQSLREIRTDMDFFPDELQSILDPSKRKKRRGNTNGADDAFSQLKALMELEGKESGDGKDGEDEEKKEGENEDEYEVDYEDEEDLVDDNDYAQNYFDNGEGDDVEDDDGDGGGDYY